MEEEAAMHPEQKRKTRKRNKRALIMDARWNVKSLLDLINRVVEDEEGLSDGAKEILADARAFLEHTKP